MLTENTENIVEDKEEKRIFAKVENPAEFIKKLQQLKTDFEEKSTFNIGDIVVWKDGLKNRNIPEYDSPGIILKIIDPPMIDTDREPSSPYYNEPLDIFVGFISTDNEFITFAQDSRRFKHFK